MPSNRPKETEVFAHLSLDDGGLHVSWRFPGSEQAPVSAHVTLHEARKWTEVLIDAGRRNRGSGSAGAYQTRDITPRSATDPGRAEEALSEVGGGIYRAIFTRDVEERWNQTFAGQKDVFIHVVFQWDSTLREKGLDPALIPFETMRRPGDGAGRLERITCDFALAKDVSIERRVTNYLGTGPSVPRKPQGLKIFVFTAPINFHDAERKEEQQEADAVIKAVRQAGQGKSVQITPVTSSAPGKATWEAFCREAQGHDVVHFIGHGKIENGIGYLAFETGDGRQDLVAMDKVATVLAQAGVSLVVLNCCETVAFSSFACELPAVVGHQYVVTGKSVEVFEKALFAALLGRGSIERAVWAGRQAIFASEPDLRWEYRTPVLYCQAREDPNAGGKAMPLEAPPLVRRTPGYRWLALFLLLLGALAVVWVFPTGEDELNRLMEEAYLISGEPAGVALLSPPRSLHRRREEVLFSVMQSRLEKRASRKGLVPGPAVMFIGAHPVLVSVAKGGALAPADWDVIAGIHGNAAKQPSRLIGIMASESAPQALAYCIVLADVKKREYRRWAIPAHTVPELLAEQSVLRNTVDYLEADTDRVSEKLEVRTIPSGGLDIEMRDKAESYPMPLKLPEGLDLQGLLGVEGATEPQVEVTVIWSAPVGISLKVVLEPGEGIPETVAMHASSEVCLRGTARAPARVAAVRFVIGRPDGVKCPAIVQLRSMEVRLVQKGGR